MLSRRGFFGALAAALGVLGFARVGEAKVESRAERDPFVAHYYFSDAGIWQFDGTRWTQVGGPTKPYSQAIWFSAEQS